MAKKAKSSPQKSPLILASASPRRAELLTQGGYTFRALTSPIAEPSRRPPAIPIDYWPTALAFIKAFSVQQTLSDPEAVVLGADTIVVLHGRIMNKPRDRTHARHMLQRLSGQTHHVITGLTLLQGDRHRFSRAVSVCRIRRLSVKWLNAYLDSGLWRGKAGAYGIQDHDDPWVTLVEGEWSNVVGLPMELLRHELVAFQQPPGG